MKTRIMALFFAAAVLTGCDSDNNRSIVGGTTGSTLTGAAHDTRDLNIPEVSVTIENGDVTRTTDTDPDGMFSFDDLPAGDYRITPSKAEYAFHPGYIDITVDTDPEEAGTFYGMKVSSRNTIAGKISDTSGDPVGGVPITITFESGNELTILSSENGMYRFNLQEGATLIVHPEDTKRNFVFEPAEAIVTSDSPLTMRHFTATQEGPELHTVSGTISFVEGHRLSVLTGIGLYDGTTARWTTPRYDGSYSFDHVADGEYTVYFEEYTSYYSFSPSKTQITVDRDDVVVPVSTASYVGIVHYNVEGRVHDESGNGVPNVTIDVRGNGFIYQNSFTTDVNGVYDDRISVFKSSPKKFILTPNAHGYVFYPDSMMVSFETLDNIRNYEETIEPFLARTDPTLSPQSLFPLAEGMEWRYRHTAPGSPVENYTMSVGGPVAANGETYLAVENPSPWYFQKLRLADDGVYSSWKDTDVLLFKFNVVAGDTWAINTVGKVYPRSGTYLGRETVTVPAGTFQDCAHYEIYLDVGEVSYERTDFWLSPDIGCVRIVHETVNYEKVIDTYTDELLEYIP